MQKNLHQWRIIFSLAGGISFFGNLMFLFFGTAKEQLWNEVPQMVVELKQRGGEHFTEVKNVENCAEKENVNVGGSRETINLV